MFVYQVVATKCVSDKNKKQIKKQALSQTQSKKNTSNSTGRSYKICTQYKKKRKDLLPKKATTSADKSAAPNKEDSVLLGNNIAKPKKEDSAPLSNNIAAPNKKDSAPLSHNIAEPNKEDFAPISHNIATLLYFVNKIKKQNFFVFYGLCFSK